MHWFREEMTSRIHLVGRNGRRILVIQTCFYCQLMCFPAELVRFRSDGQSLDTAYELYDRRDVRYSWDCE